MYPAKPDDLHSAACGGPGACHLPYQMVNLPPQGSTAACISYLLSRISYLKKKGARMDGFPSGPRCAPAGGQSAL